MTALAITRDGKRIVGAVEQLAAHGGSETSEFKSCAVQVWDFQSGKKLDCFDIDGPPLRSMTISPDGRSLISVAGDYKLNVWDLESGKRLAMAILDGILWCVAISQDGESILTGDRAGNVYCLNYHHPEKS